MPMQTLHIDMKNYCKIPFETCATHLAAKPTFLRAWNLFRGLHRSSDDFSIGRRVGELPGVHGDPPARRLGKAGHIPSLSLPTRAPASDPLVESGAEEHNASSRICGGEAALPDNCARGSIRTYTPELRRGGHRTHLGVFCVTRFGYERLGHGQSFLWFGHGCAGHRRHSGKDSAIVGAWLL